ncbi:MAG: alpha/beta fold hydrolase [Pseudomonadota bacterium]
MPSRPLFRSLALAAAALLSVDGHAADAAPAVASFFDTPQVSQAALSPKGGYVAITVMLPGGVQALAVRDTGNLTKVSVVAKTAIERAAITSIHWINENRIGFTVKNLDNEFEGNLDEFAIDRNGDNRVHLIAGNWGHQQKQIGSNMVNRTLTAEYAYHGVTHDGSDDILVERYMWNNTDLAPDHSRLMRLNTRTQSLRSAFEGAQPPAVHAWLTDGNDVPRVVTSQVKGHCIASYRNVDDTSWTEISNGVCYQDQRFVPLFFDGADTLYVRANYKGYAALFRYNLKTMKMDAEPFVETPGYDFNGGPEVDRVTRKLLGIHLRTDAGTTAWLDPTLKAEQARIDAALPGTINTVHCAQDCAASPVLLIASNSDRQPLQFILYTRASGALVGLGGTHPDLKPAEMGRRSFHRYAARDGRSIPVYVTLPAAKAGGPQPAVVLVHGGPMVRGGSWEWDAQAAFLASRGYVVIQPEFRGGTGFGADHFRAGWKQWGGTMQDDLADAARWAAKQGWADPRRVAIMGASYGGYATLMGLIKDPAVFRCGVEWAGVTDIKLMFTSTESDASKENLGYSMRRLIGDPDNAADADMLRQNSPLLRAAELKQPLLMAHGLKDLRVPIEHAKSFAAAVKVHNPNVTSIIYSDEGHGWRHPENSIAFWKQVETFLDQNLKHAE